MNGERVILESAGSTLPLRHGICDRLVGQECRPLARVLLVLFRGQGLPFVETDMRGSFADGALNIVRSYGTPPKSFFEQQAPLMLKNCR